MVACEPGQGGNTAAINIVIMCLGAPPRLTRNLSGPRLNIFGITVRDGAEGFSPDRPSELI